MISALQSAVSGLYSFGTKIQSNSNNVANANSEGFKRTRVVLKSAEPQGVESQIERIDVPGPTVFEEGADGIVPVELSNVDLARELPEMYLNSRMYEANLKTIEVVDDMIGDLLNIKS